ncbi:MAG TPA: right-handed parallel beta-helix repeat-containing protein, partial [Actinomycetota bacterium]|nr:right-handed parallel beta-helix repeat-containing protein [Actinomycetota bacterium]
MSGRRSRLVVATVTIVALAGAAAAAWISPTIGGDVEDAASRTSAAEPSVGATSPSPAGTSSPSTSSRAECTGQVPAGGDIQVAADEHGPGATICLTGSYVVAEPLRPHDGQRFVGPASIEAGPDVHTGFELKGDDSGIAVNAEDVTLIDLDVHGFGLRAVECWSGMTILGGTFHDNGRNGIGCGLEYGDGPVVIDGAEIYENGTEEQLGRGSGGIKLARLGPGGFTLRDSSVHDNLGNGVWCDVQCIGTFLIEGNTIEGNTRKGVLYEKSGASDEYIDGKIVEGEALVRANTVTGNGAEGR